MLAPTDLAGNNPDPGGWWVVGLFVFIWRLM